MRILKLLLVCFTIVFCFGESQAQRYQAEITDTVSISTYTYATKNGEELMFDLYTPALEFEKNKMVFLYVHGGGFSGGNRSAGKDLCTRLAKMGYTAVSMSYRLTRKGTETAFGCNCPASEKRATFQAAVEDIQDATSYLIQQRETFGINPQKIILGGGSAGAEAVLNAAYQPPFCYGLDSGPVSYAGVISMAGAIPDLVKVYDESAIPSMFFHGTCDNLVPYATAPHHYCKESEPGHIILHGGYSISEKLRELGKPYWLITICGGKHEWASRPMRDYFDEISRFCYEFVAQGKRQQIHTIVPGDQTKCEYSSFNFCNE
ncbi:MAG: alpha/beta hydrolase [Prolixibacteraceae bacterium]|jgi:acetyl esterase/lipase|nr:alpha/beta hydrolase [Prolixibacteraceae bacterium]